MSAARKIILITGVSSGIGKACAEHLSWGGHKVYGTVRNPDKAAGLPCEVVKMDVDDDRSVEEAVRHVREREGRIDVALNNAGIAVMGPAEETAVEQAKKVFETNVFGVHRVCRAVLPVMRGQGSGLIIQVSSLAGEMGLPFRSIYSASKFALEGYTEALRMEAAPFGVYVCLVQPGDIKTSINENRALAEDYRSGSAYEEKFETVRTLINSGVSQGLDPMAVAQCVEKIIRTPHPALRYPVALAMQKAAIPVKKMLPASLFEWIIKRHYRLT